MNEHQRPSGHRGTPSWVEWHQKRREGRRLRALVGGLGMYYTHTRLGARTKSSQRGPRSLPTRSSADAPALTAQSWQPSASFTSLRSFTCASRLHAPRPRHIGTAPSVVNACMRFGDHRSLATPGRATARLRGPGRDRARARLGGASALLLARHRLQSSCYLSRPLSIPTGSREGAGGEAAAPVVAIVARRRASPSSAQAQH